MFPCFIRIFDDAVNSVVVSGHSSCYLSNRVPISTHLSHPDDLLFGVYRSIVTRTHLLALLRNHIVNIVLASAQPEMMRINTSLVVAGMTHKHAGRNRAIVQLIRYTVGRKLAILESPLAITRGFVKVSLPSPALDRSSRNNVLPKGHFECAGTIRVTTDHLDGMAFAPLSLCIVPCGYLRLLPAAALTVAVWFKQSIRGYPRCIVVEVLGKMRDARILTHVVSPPETIGQTAGRFQRRCGQLIGCYRSSIAQMGEAAKC